MKFPFPNEGSTSPVGSTLPVKGLDSNDQKKSEKIEEADRIDLRIA